MELFLLEASGATTGFSVIALHGLKEALLSSRAKNACQILHAFKSVGENKLMLVINGDPDALVECMNSAIDGDLAVVCTPLRLGENYARHLGIEERLCLNIAPEFSPPRTFFFIRALFKHQDHTSGDMNTLIKDDTTLSLSLRLNGTIDFRLYKVVSKKEMIYIFNAESSDSLDDSVSQLLFANFGSHVNLDTKVIKPLL